MYPYLSMPQHVCPICGPVVPDHVFSGVPTPKDPHCPLCGSVAPANGPVFDQDAYKGHTHRGDTEITRVGSPTVTPWAPAPGGDVEDAELEFENEGVPAGDAWARAWTAVLSSGGDGTELSL